MIQAAPQAYLQPDPKRDCGFYATAYIARCLGHPDVTAQDVMVWRETFNRCEDWYPDAGLGLTAERAGPDAERRRPWWMGPGTREWVQRWLDDGWIGKAAVHRVDYMTHAVAALGCSEGGVHLMDPVFGFVTEPWDWFLGIGPGTYGCHRIDAWYRMTPEAAR